MQKVAKKFLSHYEVSAQEAVYRLLSLPLSKSSRQVMFIPSNLPENRTCLLKPLKVIQTMEDDNDDLVQKGIIYRYIIRPASVEYMCFADFCSHYKYEDKKKSIEQTEIDIDIDINVPEASEQNLPKTIHLHDNGGTLTLRKRPLIMRTHQFSKIKTPEEYYHSKLMLYYPWRHEETDLKRKDCMYKTKYMDVFDEIKQKVLLYEQNSDAVEDAAQELKENGVPEDAWATLASTVEQQTRRHFTAPRLHPP
jgi:hypothetical protein